MKATWKNLLLLPVCLALAAAQLRADTNASPGAAAVATVSNTAVLALPPAAPQLPVPPAPLQPPPHRGLAAEVGREVLVPIIVPLAFFTTLIVIFSLFFVCRHRRQRLLHETLRAMIDKNVPIPPELLQPTAQINCRRTRSDLRTGIIMLGIGVGLLFGHCRLAGCVLFFLGLAFLLVWKLEPKPDQNPIPNQNPQPPLQ